MTGSYSRLYEPLNKLVEVRLVYKVLLKGGNFDEFVKLLPLVYAAPLWPMILPVVWYSLKSTVAFVLRDPIIPGVGVFVPVSRIELVIGLYGSFKSGTSRMSSTFFYLLSMMRAPKLGSFHCDETGFLYWMSCGSLSWIRSLRRNDCGCPYFSWTLVVKSTRLLTSYLRRWSQLDRIRSVSYIFLFVLDAILLAI